MLNAVRSGTAINSNSSSLSKVGVLGYNLTYNADGGTGATNLTGVTSATIATPTKTGATFAGWYSQQGTAANSWNWGTKRYDGGEFVTLTANTTLYARWAYPLTLLENSLISETEASVTGDIPAGTEVTVTATTATAPEGESYAFQGWASDVSGYGGVSTASYTFKMPNSAMTLTANGMGGVPASGSATVNPFALAGDCAITVTGTSASDTVTLRDSSGNVVHVLDYNGGSVPQDGETYDVWVDGFKTSSTVTLDGSTKTVAVDMTTYTFTANLDGGAYTGFDGVITIVNPATGVVYENGSTLPTSDGYKVYLNGELVGETGDFSSLTLSFYTVTFVDENNSAYGDNTPFKPQIVLDGQEPTPPNGVPTHGSDTTKLFDGWSGLDTAVNGAAKSVTAQWDDLSSAEAKWVIDGEAYYGSLDDALEAVSSKGDGHIAVQDDAAITESVTLPSGSTLTIPDGVTVTTGDNLTNNGTITNDGTIDGNLTNSGKLVNNGELDGNLINSGTVEGGEITGNVTNTGEISGADIGGTTTQSVGGALTDCVVGDDVTGGSVDGYIYAHDGVSFSGVDALDATVNIEGGSSGFAGLTTVDGDTTTLDANIIVRETVTLDGTLDLNEHSLRGADGDTGNDGITPITVDNGGDLIVTGPGSIVGGNGSASTTGNGGDGGHAIDGSGANAVSTDEDTALVGGIGGLGSGDGNTGGAGGSGVYAGTNDTEITIEGSSTGGRGGPAVDGATGGDGGDAIAGDDAVIRDAGGTLTGGEPGDGRLADPLNDSSGGSDGSDSGKGGGDYSYIYTLNTTGLTGLTANVANLSNIAQNDEVTLSVVNSMVSLPESITVKMGGTTLTSGTGYSYNQSTGKIMILTEVTGNISITAAAVVPDSATVTTEQQLKDALEAGVPVITIPEGTTITVTGNPVNKSELYVEGTLTGSVDNQSGGKVYQKPNASVGGNMDTLTGLNPGETYLIGGSEYTADADGHIAIQESWYGESITVAQKTTDAARPAPAQTVDLTALTQADAPPASDFTVTNPSASSGDNSTGKIEGIGSGYEYSTDGGKTWTAGVDDTAVENLAGGTKVLVRVPGDNATPPSKAVEITIKTYTPPYSGGTSTPPKTPSTGDSLVIVDGKEVDAGTVTVDEKTGETKTVVNQDVIVDQIEKASDNVTVIVPIAEGSATATAELVVKNIDDMAASDMTLTVTVGGIAYELSASAVDTAAIMAQLGTDDPALAPFTVSITPITDADTQALVEQAVEIVGGEIILPAMDFTVTASFGGKTVTVAEFGAYVSRTIEITAEQAAKITTALIVEPDGTSRHVPTEVFTYGGKWYARINSLTNSTYVLIYNEQTFSDAKGKWFEPYVNEMGSRLVINGVGGGLFAGERSITRAEFAAIVIRAMGLPYHSESAFIDVASGAWYADAVNTAAHYGIVSGRGGGIFDPQANITREEAMVMMQRAANIAQYKGSTDNLSSFSDAGSVSSWAEAAARWSVGSGLIVGSDGKLRPKDEISRAETATVVLRLLQQAELVDKRS